MHIHPLNEIFNKPHVYSANTFLVHFFQEYKLRKSFELTIIAESSP